VYILDTEYLITAADSGECDCVPEPVRERESGGNRGAGDCGNGGEYDGGGDFL